MSQPAENNVESLAVARARRMLDDMVDSPFFMVMFTNRGVEVVTKGLDTDAVDAVERAMSVISEDA